VRTSLSTQGPLGSARRFRLAGRVPEQARLLALWAEAAGGARRVVLISGEPGIGKTRLVSELAHHVATAGANVAYGAGDEELEAPYRPFVNALRNLASGGETALVRLMPNGPDAATARADPEIVRLQRFDALSDWLRQQAMVTPILLILDDLHWADRSSLLLLRHLATGRADSRIMIVGTFRDEEVDRGHPLAAFLADARRIAGVERIVLRGLDVPDIAAVVAERGGGRAGAAATKGLAAWLRAHTEGNPFFVTELISHLVESGAVDDPPALATLRLPHSIREVVGRRLSALPEAAQEILACAAVVGTEFDAAVVAAAIGSPPEDVVDHLERALPRRLIIEGCDGFARYRFSHALVRQALEEEQSTVRRTRTHHRVACVLERTGAPIADLAHHFGAAAAMEDAGKALHYARLAAEEASHHVALDEAVAYLELAVETEHHLPPDAERRAGLLLDLADAKNACGRVEEARADFLAAAELARRQGRSDLLARAAASYGDWVGVWVEFGETAGPELARQALAALPPGDSVDRALCLAKCSLWEATNPDVAMRREYAIEAMAMAQRLGDPVARMPAVFAGMESLRGQAGASPQLLRLAAQLEALTDATGSVRFREASLFYRAVGAYVLNDTTTVRTAWRSLQELGERTGLRLALWMHASIASTFAVAEGRFADLPALAERERALAPVMGRLGVLIAEARRALAALLREDPEAYVAVAEPLVGEHAVVLTGWGVPATIPWARGEDALARAALCAWHDHVLPLVPAEFVFLVAGFLTRMTVQLDVPEVADTLRRILTPHAGTRCTNLTVDNGMTDHSLALLARYFGDRVAGERLLRSSIDAYRATEARAWVAVALADLAEVADDPEVAERAAAEAVAIAGAIGAPNVARRALAASSSRRAATG
ncbi:MAG: ATP-binding protein, partial [Acidimicrobiales bacterium]